METKKITSKYAPGEKAKQSSKQPNRRMSYVHRPAGNSTSNRRRRQTISHTEKSTVKPKSIKKKPNASPKKTSLSRFEENLRKLQVEQKKKARRMAAKARVVEENRRKLQLEREKKLKKKAVRRSTVLERKMRMGTQEFSQPAGSREPGEQPDQPIQPSVNVYKAKLDCITDKASLDEIFGRNPRLRRSDEFTIE
mmetsp:Transcript_11500/g.16114  ORF Transcript_11500/g.16114 Transcript_11500/m.16114 type:complete len:195 (+) Transcript_11500:212-796(+)